MNEREELDEEWETWELIQNMANVSKRFGFFILFCNFSYFPAIARSCCQAKLPPRHVVDVALSALSGAAMEPSPCAGCEPNQC